MVVEEETLARVERGDGGHIFVGECEVENVDVLPHPLHMGRFGDDDNAALNEPAQSRCARYSSSESVGTMPRLSATIMSCRYSMQFNSSDAKI